MKTHNLSTKTLFSFVLIFLGLNLISCTKISPTGTVLESLNNDPDNNAPVAIDDSFFIKSGTTVFVPVIDNDTDTEQDDLIIDSFEASEFATVAISSDKKNLIVSPNNNFSGKIAIPYKIKDTNSGTSQATLSLKVIKGKNWIGSVSDKVSAKENWCSETTIGSESLVKECQDSLAISTTNELYFNSNCINCNVTIDTSIAVNKIVMHQNFSQGSLTQSLGVTIGTDNEFLVAGGAFIGGNSAITVKGDLHILNSSQFQSTSGILNIGKNVKISSDVTFAHNNGELKLKTFSPATQTTIEIDDQVLSKFTVNKTDSNPSTNENITFNKTFTVMGQLLISNDENGASHLIRESAAEILLVGNIASDGGTGGDLPIVLVGTNTSEIVKTGSGSAILPSLIISKSSGAGVLFKTGTSNTTSIGGDLRYFEGTLNYESASHTVAMVSCISTTCPAATFKWSNSNALPNLNLNKAGQNINIDDTSVSLISNFECNATIVGGTLNISKDVSLSTGCSADNTSLMLAGNLDSGFYSSLSTLPSFDNIVIQKDIGKKVVWNSPTATANQTDFLIANGELQVTDSASLYNAKTITVDGANSILRKKDPTTNVTVDGGIINTINGGQILNNPI